MNIDLQSWVIIRTLLLGTEESEENDKTKSRFIPPGIIPAFVAEIDKKLEYPGV